MEEDALLSCLRLLEKEKMCEDGKEGIGEGMPCVRRRQGVEHRKRMG